MNWEFMDFTAHAHLYAAQGDPQPTVQTSYSTHDAQLKQCTLIYHEE